MQAFPATGMALSSHSSSSLCCGARDVPCSARFRSVVGSAAAQAEKQPWPAQAAAGQGRRLHAAVEILGIGLAGAGTVARRRRHGRLRLQTVLRAADERGRADVSLQVPRRTVLGLATLGSPGLANAEGLGRLPQRVQATNEVMGVVDGIRQKRLGASDIVVSELALGTQRWCSTDFNAPDEKACHAFLDRAVLGSGVNLIDTAEQYPIPSGDDRRSSEGATEECIGRWLAKDRGRRKKVVIATKITGGYNVTPENIRQDCEGSLRRLGTDYLDVYQLHWPARYSPQSNWGQSLTYQFDMEDGGGMSQVGASFEEICTAMGKLIAEGKIRGWGLCNDNAFGLTACCEVAKRLGVPPPVSFQGDYSLIDRKSEENGVFEASSPVHENVGFLAYNSLAGGMLTGKYVDAPAAVDEPNPAAAAVRAASPRGRFDDISWGLTLYRYRSTAAKEAIRAYADLSKRFGLSLSELSLRWCRERRGCTSVLLGTSNMSQLEEDLRFFQKSEPLPRELMWEIDRVHLRNRLPIFSADRTESNRKGKGNLGERIP